MGPAAAHIQSAYDAFNRRDIDAFVEHLHPRVRWVTLDLAQGPCVYNGRDGVRSYLDALLSSDVTITSEPQELVEYGDRVLARLVHRATNRRTGHEISYRTVQVWRMRDGLAAHYRLHLDERQAVRRAGGSVICPPLPTSVDSAASPTGAVIQTGGSETP